MGILGARRKSLILMPKKKLSDAQRLARLRQDNPIASAPPPAIYADAPVNNRKVAQNGSISMSEFAPGIRVNVVRIDGETVVVSSRPPGEVRVIAANMPKAASSPFSALSASVRGRKFELATTRTHAAYAGPVRVPQVSDQEVFDASDTERTHRVR